VSPTWYRQREDRNDRNVYMHCHQATNRTDPQYWLSTTLDVPLQLPLSSLVVTNFIWPYLHQFFDDSHGLNGYGKPLKRPFDRYQSRLEAISIGQDIRQINWQPLWYRLLNHQYLRNRHDLSFSSRLIRSPLHTAQNEPRTTSRQSVSMEIWRPQCLHMDFINYP